MSAILVASMVSDLCASLWFEFKRTWTKCCYQCVFYSGNFPYLLIFVSQDQCVLSTECTQKTTLEHKTMNDSVYVGFLLRIIHVMLHLTQGERNHLPLSLNSLLSYCSMYNNWAALESDMMRRTVNFYLIKHWRVLNQVNTDTEFISRIVCLYR